MAYNIFSQPQGPQIDVNLFGSAVAQGVQTGNQLPTPLTAGIRGLQEGIKAGQQYQQAEHEISQYPVQDAIQQQRLEAMQYENQINQINAQVAQQNKDTILESKSLAAQNELKLAQQQKAIQDNMASGDPAKIKASFGPEYSSYWGAHPKEHEEALRSSWGLFDDKEKDAYGSQVYSSAWLDHIDKIKAGNPEAKELAKVFREALGTAGVNAAQSQASAFYGRNVLPNEFFSLSMVDSNLYETEVDKESGKTKVKLNPNGTLKRKEEYSPGLTSFLIDMASPEKFVVGTLDEESRKDFAKGQAAAQGLGAAFPLPYAPGRKSAAQNFVGATNIPSGVNPYYQQPAWEQQQAVTPTPQQTTNTVEGTAASELNARAQGASPEEQAKVQSITGQLKAKQQQNSVENVPTPAPTPTPSPASPGVTQKLEAAPRYKAASLLEKASDFLIPPVLAEEFDPRTKTTTKTVLLPSGTEFSTSAKTVNTVNTHPLLKGEHPIIRAIAAVESGGITNAKSKTGVKGLLQVTKPVAESYGLDRNKPEDNLLAGKLYMRDLLQDFDGDVELSLAAYNGGPGLIRQAMRVVNSSNFEDVIEGLKYLHVKGLITSAKLKEITNYPSKVLSYLSSFKSK